MNRKNEYIAYFTKLIMDTHLVYDLPDKKIHIVGTEKIWSWDNFDRFL